MAALFFVFAIAFLLICFQFPILLQGKFHSHLGVFVEGIVVTDVRKFVGVLVGADFMDFLVRTSPPLISYWRRRVCPPRKKSVLLLFVVWNLRLAGFIVVVVAGRKAVSAVVQERSNFLVAVIVRIFAGLGCCRYSKYLDILTFPRIEEGSRPGLLPLFSCSCCSTRFEFLHRGILFPRAPTVWVTDHHQGR